MQIAPSKLQNLLLYDLSQVYEGIFRVLKTEALALLPAAILVGAALTFLFGMDFGGVIKRAVLGVGAIFLFQWFFVGSANIGIKLGDSLISKDNHILRTWDEATTIRKEGFRDTYKRPGDKAAGEGMLQKWGKDILGFLIWLLSNFALWFVKISFTISYYMPLLMIPIVALVNIFPLTNRSLEGSIFTAAWIMVTPVVIAVLLELLNAILVSDNIMESASWISKAIMGILFALYLISSFMLTAKMIGRSGISEGISNIGQSFGAGMVTGAVMWGFTKTRRMGKNFAWGQGGNHSPLRKMTVDPVNNMRSKIYQKAQSVRSDKSQSAQEVLEKKDPGRSKNEKKILAANVVLNPAKAVRDHLDRQKVAKQSIKAGDVDKPIDLKATNEFRKEQGKQLINNRGVSYGPKDRVPLKYQNTTKEVQSTQKSQHTKGHEKSSKQDRSSDQSKQHTKEVIKNNKPTPLKVDKKKKRSMPRVTEVQNEL